MQTFLNFVIRLVLLAAGLLFAASLTLAVVLMLALWAVRYGWARLTGRPVTPFVMRVDPRGGFDRMARRGPAAKASAREIGDVTDVEAKPPRD